MKCWKLLDLGIMFSVLQEGKHIPGVLSMAEKVEDKPRARDDSEETKPLQQTSASQTSMYNRIKPGIFKTQTLLQECWGETLESIFLISIQVMSVLLVPSRTTDYLNTTNAIANKKKFIRNGHQTSKSSQRNNWQLIQLPIEELLRTTS